MTANFTEQTVQLFAPLVGEKLMSASAILGGHKSVTPKTEPEVAPPPYEHPPVSVGDTVLVYDAPNDQSPSPALVVVVGDRTLNAIIFPRDTVGGAWVTGVFHITDPGSDVPKKCKFWSHTASHAELQYTRRVVDELREAVVEQRKRKPRSEESKKAE